MPVIKSAIKKLRKDKKREKENSVFMNLVEKALKTAKKEKTLKSISAAVSLVDKAVKKNLLHKNKAARVKSGLSKIAPSSKVPKKVETKSPVVKKKIVKAPVKTARTAKK